MMKKFIIFLICFQTCNFCYGIVNDRKSCLEACEVFNGPMQLCCFNCCYNNFEIGKIEMSEQEEVEGINS